MNDLDNHNKHSIPDTLLSDFSENAAIVVHELKTPLAAIVQFMEMIYTDDSGLSAEKTELVSKIWAESIAALEMISHVHDEYTQKLESKDGQDSVDK